ncbi:threonine/serine exporter family protein [Desulfovibrio sp. OttesenSCG-928-F20]|nr:threonine/serine exporter family protein [Desulfovibrio sp. OttesenSCG-928-M16]MDL2291089.1 threonine/serine exporter family protein [Desulfovibrio sp. OttesenSCG-928-F20]
MSSFLLLFLQDMFFAGLAGVGFCLAVNPPSRIIPVVAALAAVGHGLRFALTYSAHMGISTGSLLAGFIIGLGSVIATTRMRVPAEFFAFPALLPMIPGLAAYKAILSLLNFMGATAPADKQYWLLLTADNGFTALLVLCALGTGALIPIMLFHHPRFLTAAIWKQRPRNIPPPSNLPSNPR